MYCWVFLILLVSSLLNKATVLSSVSASWPTCLSFFSSFIWPFQSFISWPIHLGRVLSMFQGRLTIPSLPFRFHMSDFQLGWTVKHSQSSPLALSLWARCILAWHLGQGGGSWVATEGLNEEPYFLCHRWRGKNLIWILFTSNSSCFSEYNCQAFYIYIINYDLLI